MPLTRRTVLLGTGAAFAGAAAVGAGVEEGWLPGRYRLRRTLGLTGPSGHIPRVTPGKVVEGTFVSQRRLGAETGWSIIYPGPVTEPLPVLVALHGLGGSHRSWIDELGVDRFLPAAVVAGVPRFAVATVDGGTTYWHPRPTGEDAGAMVTEEFLPLLAAHGLRTDRIAFAGYSMGGYGSLRLAPIVGLPAVRAVAVSSAALWVDPDDASVSGFADAAEYLQYTVFGHQADLDGIDVRLDCGTDDPFYAADQEYVTGFSRPIVASFGPGAHDAAFWTRMMPAQLAFIGRALASGT